MQTITISIGAHAPGSLNCVAMASSNFHFATVVVGEKAYEMTSPASDTAAPMTMADGNGIIALPDQDQPYVISITFAHAPTADGPRASTDAFSIGSTHVGDFSATQIGGADIRGVQCLALTATVVVPSSTAPSPAPRNAAAFAPTPPQLELHAKTYYDNPLVEGGDEHFFTIPNTVGTDGSAQLEYSSTGWTALDKSAWFQFTPFGGYLHIYVKAGNCTHPDMHGATLTISTAYGYWLVIPTGWGTADWQCDLSGTKYTVTRIIN